MARVIDFGIAFAPELPRTHMMPLAQPAHPLPQSAPVPRAEGSLVLSSKARSGLSVIDDLRSAGCARVVFPRRTDAVEAIIVNSSGGLTGGDRFETTAHAGAGSRLILTTQAAERAYRSAAGHAQVSTHLSVDKDASLTWLPQELIVFDGAALKRSLRVDLARGATFLMAEPVVFGRAAMGETVTTLGFWDRVQIRLDGQPVYTDSIALDGAAQTRLAHTATAAGHQAMASVVLVAPNAEAHLHRIRAGLPPTAGASLLAHDLLVLRILARDGFDLRRTLCPVLETLSGAALPRSWRL